MTKKPQPRRKTDFLNKQNKFISDYTEERSKYQTFARILKEILNNIAKDYDPLAVVMARAKGVSSFAEKIIKKAKYQDPLREVTDLAGARIIVHFPHQVEKVCKFIRDNFEIDEVNSLDHRSHLRIGEFGYRSVHYIVTPNRLKIKGVEIPEEIRTLKAEIQVRTFLEHTWADIGHDRLYKTNIKVPEQWNREAARIAAIMENVDREFTHMANTLDTFATGFRVNYTQETIGKEIEKLEALVKLENDPEIKLQNIFRLCNVYAVQESWQKIVEIIDENLADQKNEFHVARIKGEYFHAQIMLLNGKNKQEAFDKAASGLVVAAEKLEEIGKQDNVVDTFTITFAAARLYYYLGQAYGRFSDTDKAREHFDKAHRLVPDDPYFFSDAVAFEVMGCQESTVKHLLNLIAPQITHATGMCRIHLEIGANAALAYMTLGRLNFLLGREGEALSSYAKAVDLILRRETIVPDEYLRTEMKLLSEIGKKVDLSLSHQISLLIGLALKIKVNDEWADRYLEQEFKYRIRVKKKFKKPVLIIAGGAEGIPENQIDTSHEYVREALSDFEGTVISGGTESGIPGIVANVYNLLKKTGHPFFKLYGYLPDDPLPEDARIDKDYDVIYRTQGQGFSTLELLNYWYDILMSGIDPSEVFVLGINGGRISDLEYRLALAFGAKVGLITGSGRAVTDLKLNADWKDHPNLLPVPDDKYTIWALVNYSKRSVIIDEDDTGAKTEEMAKAIHEAYRQMALNEFNKKSTDVNHFKPVMDWKYLDPALQDSNRHQARMMEHVLNKTGFQIVKAEKLLPVKFNKKERESLAEIEHARWNAERLFGGWRHAPEKNIEKKLTPYLVSWENLPDYIKKFDRNAVDEFPKILRSVGYGIKHR